MASASFWNYVFIRTSIFLLHLVAPLSIFYSLARWLVHPWFHVPRILEIWLALEAVFYLVVYLPLSLYLQATATHPTIACRSDRRKLFRHCQDNIPDPERYLTKWFRDAPAAEIKRENVKDFFRWAFLNTGDPDPEHDEELEEYTSGMEKLLGRKLELGNGSARCLRLTVDRVEMLHRSLTWNLVSDGEDICRRMPTMQPSQGTNCTRSYSASSLSTRWRLAIYNITPSNSTAHPFLPSSHYALSHSLVQSPPLHGA